MKVVHVKLTHAEHDRIAAYGRPEEFLRTTAIGAIELREQLDAAVSPPSQTEGINLGKLVESFATDQEDGPIPSRPLPEFDVDFPAADLPISHAHKIELRGAPPVMPPTPAAEDMEKAKQTWADADALFADSKAFEELTGSVGTFDQLVAFAKHKREPSMGKRSIILWDRLMSLRIMLDSIARGPVVKAKYGAVAEALMQANREVDGIAIIAARFHRQQDEV